MGRALSPSESEALAKSEGLLRFAAENVKELPEPVVSTICTALDAKQASTWDQKIATDFWCAFNSLCSLIKPVTVDTLSTNLREIPPPKWKFWVRVPEPLSLSQRSADRYLSLLMFLLCFAAILLFLNSTTTRLSTEIQKLVDDGNQLTEKMVSEIDLLEPAIGKRNFSEVEAKHKKEIALLQDQLQQQDYLKDQMVQKSEVMTRLLWLGLRGQTYSPTYNKARNPRRAADVAESRDAVQQYLICRKDVEIDLLNVSMKATVISSSVLPIILGIIGACAYVVRLISDQIKDTTFSRTSPIRHLVRIALGGLAGVVIGFGGVANAASLSPSALAFIAGYAVEPVFAAVDTIAEKFRR